MSHAHTLAHTHTHSLLLSFFLFHVRTRTLTHTRTHIHAQALTHTHTDKGSTSSIDAHLERKRAHAASEDLPPASISSSNKKDKKDQAHVGIEDTRGKRDNRDDVRVNDVAVANSQRVCLMWSLCGVWYVMCVVWCVVCGVWCVVCGVWCV